MDQFRRHKSRLQSQNTEHIATWTSRPNCASSGKCRRGIEGGGFSGKLWLRPPSGFAAPDQTYGLDWIVENLVKLQQSQVPTCQTRGVHSTKCSTRNNRHIL